MRQEPTPTDGGAVPPRPRLALGVVVVSVVVTAISYWLATRAGAPDAQEGLARWFNDPPGVLGGALSLVNPVFRPLPLALLTVGLLTWVMVTSATTRTRLEVLRALVVAFAIARTSASVLKSLADQPRPLVVFPDLDSHGYPRELSTNAFPSSHTAVVVGLVVAIWPWLRPSHRVVGVVVAVLAALNRAYIGAHWLLDLVGGAAIGFGAGAAAWLVARRWPVRWPRSPVDEVVPADT